jgi:predicted AlkP superfamily pyrophosphatase or phosphodiesterase
MKRLHWAALAVLAFLTVASVPASSASRRAPRLVVLLAVDQMRADYIDRFQQQWKGGLRRLVDEGAVFKQADYPYFGTLTCAGHASISTGSVPANHGMILDGWWDSSSARRVLCTAMPDAKVVRYGQGGRGGTGPAAMMMPTLSDEMRMQLPERPRIAAFSVKSRAAVVLAGRQADAIAWFDDGDAWVSSTAYSAAPVPFLAEFVKANPVERDLGKTWSPMLAANAYLYDEHRAAGEPDFPHVLEGDGDKPDAKFYTAWKTSPFADDYVGRLGMAAVEHLKLGQGPGTDFLALGFSAPDYVGHEYGPRSREVQDTFVRLDATIGKLLAQLDRLVGRGQYVVALTADHGVAPIPEWASQEGYDAGRIVRADVVQRVDQALAGLLGPGKYAASMNHIEFYFAPGVYQRLLGQPEALKLAIDTIMAVPGVARVFRSDELRQGAFVADPLGRQVAASYYPGRSGDLVVIPKPYWYTWDRGADHGTGYLYDVRVPVILMGKGIRPGEYLQPASPLDVAPTLAMVSGVTLARPDGRVLVEALVPLPGVTATDAGSR